MSTDFYGSLSVDLEIDLDVDVNLDANFIKGVGEIEEIEEEQGRRREKKWRIKGQAKNN